MPPRKRTRQPTNTHVASPQEAELFEKLPKVVWFAIARDLFEEYMSNEVDALDPDGHLYTFTGECKRRERILRDEGIIYRGSKHHVNP